MLDAVGRTEFHQEFDEVSEVLDVVVVAFVGFEVSQEDYVVMEIQRAVGLRQNNDCG